ncbi:MAG TPA: phosphoribosylglycinamide formyltransferase [Brevundimonas sp.]|jgi:formyltetrahydrofolate-dependent phosphoribosylglycinamide formyltransferase|nr:phosphoribosylglycinamide formyltransferase [Brevundimonas sp.]MBU2380955.1 phosphoribosylglycinamide formyltransferase [Alphaproteobacteria bacterium]HAF81272.1 phosphoribosylglycinamide formyltransferase [Brevundimonas sp.]
MGAAMSSQAASPVRVAVLISGTGSNMAALIDAGQTADSGYDVALVISNIEDAGGLAVAAAKGVQTLSIPHKPFGKDREAHERAVDAALRAAGVEVVALAGYMRILTPWLVRAWEGRMLNIHPSLLPLYPGLDTHARALAAGDAEAGCTVHLVTEGVDEGPVLGQARVRIIDGDTPAALAERVKTAEHRLYPQVLRNFCQGLVRD